MAREYQNGQMSASSHEGPGTRDGKTKMGLFCYLTALIGFKTLLELGRWLFD